MWSIKSDVWKAACMTNSGLTAVGSYAHRELPSAERWKLNVGPVTWRNVAQHHTGMTPANQRTRKSTLRRRAIAKQTVRTEQYAAAARNLSLLLTGARHDAN